MNQLSADRGGYWMWAAGRRSVQLLCRAATAVAEGRLFETPSVVEVVAMLGC